MLSHAKIFNRLSIFVICTYKTYISLPHCVHIFDYSKKQMMIQLTLLTWLLLVSCPHFLCVIIIISLYLFSIHHVVVSSSPPFSFFLHHRELHVSWSLHFTPPLLPGNPSIVTKKKASSARDHYYFVSCLMTFILLNYTTCHVFPGLPLSTIFMVPCQFSLVCNEGI